MLKQVISWRIDPSDYIFLKEMAHINKITVSELFRIIVGDFDFKKLKEHPEITEAYKDHEREKILRNGKRIMRDGFFLDRFFMTLFRCLESKLVPQDYVEQIILSYEKESILIGYETFIKEIQYVKDKAKEPSWESTLVEYLQERKDSIRGLRVYGKKKRDRERGR